MLISHEFKVVLSLVNQSSFMWSECSSYQPVFQRPASTDHKRCRISATKRLPKQKTQIVPVAKQRIATQIRHRPVDRRAEMVNAGPRIPMRTLSLPMGVGITPVEHLHRNNPISPKLHPAKPASLASAHSAEGGEAVAISIHPTFPARRNKSRRRKSFSRQWPLPSASAG